jgi:hypothetical protein
MQKRISFCLEEGNIQFYAAIMEAFQMKNHRNSTFIRSFPQRLDSIWQPASRFHTIESTYPQLL